MNINKISSESYESIKGYLDIMLSIVPSLNDLCFIDYNGKRYMLGISVGTVGIVENDNGELNSYSYNLNDADKISYDTEEYGVEIYLTDGIKEVKRINKFNNNQELLSYLPPVDNYPRAILSYVQYIDQIVSSMEFKYDVTRRNNVSDSISYTLYHSPDIIELTTLKQLLSLFYRKKYVFCMGIDDNLYYQPLFNIGNIYFGTKKYTMNPKDLLESFHEEGFNQQIPYELSSLINGSESEYTKIKNLTDNYMQYIRRQK